MGQFRGIDDMLSELTRLKWERTWEARTGTARCCKETLTDLGHVGAQQVIIHFTL